jgi:hypothetical protein
MVLKKEHYNTILKYINILCPNKRKPKYSNEYYLKNIISMLTKFVSWRALAESINYKNGVLRGESEETIKNDNHYKTINSKHILWSKAGVYEKAYLEIMKKKIKNINEDTLKLIIDATQIIFQINMDKKILVMGAKIRKKSLLN